MNGITVVTVDAQHRARRSDRIPIKPSYQLRVRTCQLLTTEDRRLKSGGADRDRTGGLLVANQALSQLSYSPNCSRQSSVVSRQKAFAED